MLHICICIYVIYIFMYMYIYSSFNFSSYMSCFIVLVTKKLEFTRVRSSLRAVGDTVRTEDVLYKSSHMYYTHTYMYIHTYVHMYICTHIQFICFLIYETLYLSFDRISSSKRASDRVPMPLAMHNVQMLRARHHMCVIHIHIHVFIFI